MNQNDRIYTRNPCISADGGTRAEQPLLVWESSKTDPWWEAEKAGINTWNRKIFCLQIFENLEIFELFRKFSIFRIRLYRRDLVELLKNVFTKFDDSSIQPRTDPPKFWRLLSKNTKEPAPTRLDHNFAKSARIRLRFCSLFANIS